MDKIYDKPTATHIVFYSEEKIAFEMPLKGIWAYNSDGGTDLGPDVSFGAGDGEPDWED